MIFPKSIDPAVYAKLLPLGHEEADGLHIDPTTDAYRRAMFELRGMDPDAPLPKKQDPVKAAPKWPLICRGLRFLRMTDDVGVGDVVHRLAAAVGGETVAWWYEQIVGAPCGCADRRAKLNKMYPFPPS